jgi:hypothetical protein
MYQITLEIQRTEEGPYLGTSPDLPGLIVQGVTPEQVVELAPDVAREADIRDDRDGTAAARRAPSALQPYPRPARRPGVTYAELTRKLRELGCVFKRQAIDLGLGLLRVRPQELPDRVPLS